MGDEEEGEEPGTKRKADNNISPSHEQPNEKRLNDKMTEDTDSELDREAEDGNESDGSRGKNIKAERQELKRLKSAVKSMEDKASGDEKEVLKRIAETIAALEVGCSRAKKELSSYRGVMNKKCKDLEKKIKELQVGTERMDAMEEQITSMKKILEEQMEQRVGATEKVVEEMKTSLTEQKLGRTQDVSMLEERSASIRDDMNKMKDIVLTAAEEKMKTTLQEKQKEHAANITKEVEKAMDLKGKENKEMLESTKEARKNMEVQASKAAEAEKQRDATSK